MCLPAALAHPTETSNWACMFLVGMICSACDYQGPKAFYLACWPQTSTPARMSLISIIYLQFDNRPIAFCWPALVIPLLPPIRPNIYACMVAAARVSVASGKKEPQAFCHAHPLRHLAHACRCCHVERTNFTVSCRPAFGADVVLLTRMHCVQNVRRSLMHPSKFYCRKEEGKWYAMPAIVWSI